MKTKLVQFEIDQGETLLIEVDDPACDGVVRRSSVNGLQQKLEQSVVRFESAIQIVQTVGNSVVEKMRQLTRQPDEVNIKIGLKFTAEAGAIIAKTSGEGNLELSITWKK